MASQAAAGVTLTRGSTIWSPGVHKTVLFGNNPVAGTAAPWKGSIISHAGLTQVPAGFNDSTLNPDGSVKKTTTTAKPEYTTVWGMRFHWNPPQISVNTSMDDTIDNNPLDPFLQAGMASTHQQIISFDFDLVRIPDMTETDLGAFSPSLPNSAMLTHIKQRGTLVDLDYMFHAANGNQVLVEAGYTTADLGFIFPSMVQFTISPYWKFYGFIQQCQVTHKQFSTRMVPTHTTVHLDVIRLSNTGGGDGSGYYSVSQNPNDQVQIEQGRGGKRFS